MKQSKNNSLLFSAAVFSLFTLTSSAYAIGEQACEVEVTDMFPGISMADVVATPAVPIKHGALRVDWTVNTDNETARGFCKVTKGGDVVRVKTLHHKRYDEGSESDQYDGFYYDEHIGKWRDDTGEICHTCTPDNGFPDHAGNGRKYRDQSSLEQQMEQNLEDSLSRQDIRDLNNWADSQ